MGAVATLLYAQQHHKQPSRERHGIMPNGHSLRSSLANSRSSIRWEEDEKLVKAIVLDSPFHNFKDIAR